MPAKIESTHQLIERQLVVYQRPTSDVWQCRYTLDNKKWYCKSTGHRDLKAAIPKAHEILIGARLLDERNLPVVSKKFGDIAKLAITTMEDNKGFEVGSDSFPQYIRIINDLLIPFFGKLQIDSINAKVMLEFDKWRATQLKRIPAYSSVRKHNVALNRVFKEAEERGYVHKKQIPYLETKGAKSKQYPSFDIVEINAILAGMPEWSVNTKHKKSWWRRHVLHDYVRVLIETGARPGKELLDLKWKNIKIKKVQKGGIVTMPDVAETEFDPAGEQQYMELVPSECKYEEDGSPIDNALSEVTVYLDVYGKTKDRTVNGFAMTYKVLKEIVARNYIGEKATTVEKLTECKCEDYVFRSIWNIQEDTKTATQCFNHMFDNFLADHNLHIDPKTGRKRVFYSIRSAFTTAALNLDAIPIRDLSKQLGNSVVMIQKHYDRATGEAITKNVKATNTHSAFFDAAKIPDIYKSNKLNKLNSVT